MPKREEGIGSRVFGFKANGQISHDFDIHGKNQTKKRK
jgi:hypothetical protein